MTVSVVPGVDSAGLYIFGAFVLIALGSGCIRPNLATLGADQYQAVEEKEEQKRFFVWYALVCTTMCGAVSELHERVLRDVRLYLRLGRIHLVMALSGPTLIRRLAYCHYSSSSL